MQRAFFASQTTVLSEDEMRANDFRKQYARLNFEKHNALPSSRGKKSVPRKDAILSFACLSCFDAQSCESIASNGFAAEAMNGLQT
jgi:hypothetical protein